MRQELEALAAEQQAETAIDFIEPAQAASPGASKAGEESSAHPLLKMIFEAASQRTIQNRMFVSLQFLGRSRKGVQCKATMFFAGAALELPKMADLTKAGHPSLKRAIYSLGGRRAVAKQYNLDCKL